MVIAFSSDWLYPPFQSKEIVKALKMNGIDVTYCEVSSNYGHDAFLLEFAEETKLIGHFLDNIYKKIAKILVILSHFLNTDITISAKKISHIY